MRLPRLMLAAMLTMLPLITGCQTGARKPVTIERHIQGSDPALKYADLTVVNSKADLQKLGSQDLINQKLDLDKYTLVVWSMGEEKTGGYWAHIDGVQRKGHDLFVQATLNQPSDDQAKMGAAGFPYDAVLVAKTRAAMAHPEPNLVKGQNPPMELPAPMAPAGTTPNKAP